MNGSVISDGNGVLNIVHQPANHPVVGTLPLKGHEYVKSYPEAAAIALRAGLDQSWDGDEAPTDRMGNERGIVATALKQPNTSLTMSTVRTAAAHTLRSRFNVGLYDASDAKSGRANPWIDIPPSVILSQAHVDLAER